MKKKYLIFLQLTVSRRPRALLLIFPYINWCMGWTNFQGHTSREWQSWGLNTSSPVPEPMPLNLHAKSDFQKWVDILKKKSQKWRLNSVRTMQSRWLVGMSEKIPKESSRDKVYRMRTAESFPELIKVQNSIQKAVYPKQEE